MKLKNIAISNNDFIGAIKNSLLNSAIAYGKVYELTHKQLYRKGRIAFLGSTFTLHNRPVRPIRYYDIKTPSTSPYNRDSYNDLGLNQLFMGQDPYSSYDGNPSDGIYHDTCQIVPKSNYAFDVGATNSMGWRIGVEGAYVYKDKYSMDGVELISSVTLVEIDSATATAHIVYANGTVEDIDCGSITDVNGVVIHGTVDYLDLTALGVSSQIAQHPIVSGHGEIIQTGTTTVSIPQYNPMNAKFWVYEDGLALALTYVWKTQDEIDGVDGDNASGSFNFVEVMQLLILPLCYMDTGDLVQNRVGFIENWSKEFELNVVEDDYWYSGLVTFVEIVVSMIVAIYSQNYYIIAGAFISDVGLLSGNKDIQLAGAVIGIYGAIEEIGERAIAKEAMESGLSTRAASQIAMESSIKEVFEHFISGAGLGNLLKVGIKLEDIFQEADSLNNGQTPTAKDTATKESTKVTIKDNDDSGMSYVQKIMRIGDI